MSIIARTNSPVNQGSTYAYPESMLREIAAQRARVSVYRIEHKGLGQYDVRETGTGRVVAHFLGSSIHGVIAATRAMYPHAEDAATFDCEAP